MARVPEVLLVDQDQSARFEMKQLVRQAQLGFAGEAAFGTEAVSLASEVKPDLIICGMSEPPERALQTIEAILRSGRSFAIRSAAVAAIATVDLKRGAAGAVNVFPDATTQEMIAVLVSPFLSRQGGSEALARALSEADLSIDQAKLTHRVLSAAGRSDRALLAVLNDSIGIENEELEYDAEFVRALATEAMSKGDAARGRKVFSSKLANCTACHRVAGRGEAIGPELSKIGEIRGPADLVEAVLFPSASLARGYESFNVVTSGGQVYSGLLSRETASAIYLRTTERAEIRVNRDDIDQFAPNSTSIMPQGLDKTLSPAELRDLVAFLESLK